MSHLRRYTSASWVFRFAVTCAVFLPVGGFAQIPEAKKVQEVRELISNLGADQFVVRENATKQLFQLGVGDQREITIKEIERAAQESDREVRERARRILDLLKDRLREEGLQTFLSGGKIDDVPGWKHFSDKYGKTEASRSVFVMIVKEEWDLLETCLDQNASTEEKDANGETTPPNQPAVDQIQVRRNAINVRLTEAINGQYTTRYQNMPLGSILGFYVVGEFAPESLDNPSQLLHLMIAVPKLREELRGTPKEGSAREIIRQIVGNWMMATIKHNSRYETPILSTAMTNRMADEAKQIATHILKNPQSLVATKRSAMQTLVAFRDPAGIALIEPYLTDKRLLTPNRKKLQLRDVALTCLMDLHGHDVSQIGVKRVASLGHVYDFSSLGFDTEEARQEAFDLFEELQDEKARKKRELEKKNAKSSQ